MNNKTYYQVCQQVWRLWAIETSYSFKSA